MRNGCWFDERRASYVVEWFGKFLQLSDSVWAGKPFVPLQWQVDEILYPLYGWHRQDECGRTVRRFNRTYIQIPKKNGKSTLAAGIGLYHLCGEANRGNEVYSAATTKEQASIVHGEAIRMVESSENLRALLKINHHTKNIYSKDTLSTYKALSSRPEGNEGLKGSCCIIDELHAWHGDELWNALRYMGVNWPERLIFVITTAGADKESVCYRQYEHAKGILAGTVQDDRVLAVIHEAHHDDDIEDETVQRKANPSLGYTIQRQDLIQDIREAKQSARTLSALLRYRFNVWATSSNPWLDPGVWASATDDAVTTHDLEGLPCYGALDLARKNDMSAFALLFRRYDGWYLKVKFWLPEATADRWTHLAPYRDWQRNGWLTLTPGDVADYRQIETDVAALCEQYRVRQLGFDPYYAEELSQRIEESTGIERIAFGQTITNFAPATAAFERMLTSGELKHEANPLLAWQAGNVEVRTDGNQNMRPVKPERNSYKSIDGIVAGIMAVGLGLRDDGYESVYDLPPEQRPVWV